MRKTCLLITFFMVFGIIFTGLPAPVSAADFTATVNFNTTSPKSILPSASGHHAELGGNGFKWSNPDLINRTNQYEGMGYVRINGTNLNPYDWKTASYGVEALGQLQGDDKHFYGYTTSARMVEAKGGESLKDLREFLQQTGTKVVIPVNVFTNTVEQIGDMAKYCYENHIPVLYFELGNEVSYYTAETNLSRSDRFKTGTDYLKRMEAYNTAIKNNYPGAKTVVAMDNDKRLSFNEDFKAYPNKFWDLATMHRFVGNGDTIDTAMISANDGLSSWNNYITHYVNNTSSTQRFQMGELSVNLTGILSMTHYNGIFVAESGLRLSTHAKMDRFQSWRVPGGYAYAATDNKDKLQDAYQRNQVLDSDTLTFDYYDTAPAVSARVVDGAMNNSSAAYTTTTTGGTTVENLNGTMPAIYAQAYRGMNGKDYVVMVNKSASTHNVTLKKDNIALNQAMTTTFVTANPGDENTNTSRPVYLQTGTVAAGSPVFLPAYSVTRVEWIRSAAPDIPLVPWLSHANVKNNGVDLKWHKSLNATGYKIKYGTTPDNMPTIIDVGNVTSYSINGLTNGTTYYFAAAAYNSAGTSAYSNTDTSDTVSAKLAVPAAPTIKKSHYEISGRVAVEWQSVPNAAGYKLKYGTSSGSYPNIIDVGNNVGAYAEGLTNGQTYYFVVSAYNAFGDSSNSAEVTATPSADVPLAPHDVSIDSETTTSINISWTNARSPRESENFENGNTNWNNALGAWSVVNHFDTSRATKVYKSPASGTAITVLPNASSGDLEGEARVYVNGAFATGSQVGVVARYTDNDNYYAFVYDKASDTFKLLKKRLGTVTQLASASGSDDSDMVMRLEVKGNVLTGVLNNGELLTATDATNQLTGGIFGLITTSQETYFDEVYIRKEIGTVNVYRSTDPHSSFTLQASGLTGTTWSQTGLTASETYYYYLTTTYNGRESYDHSNTIMKD